MSEFYSALAATLFFVLVFAIGIIGHAVIRIRKIDKQQAAAFRNVQRLHSPVETARDAYRSRAEYERVKRESIAMVRDGEWR